LDRLILARGQMAMTLAFHIVFAAIGIALPLAMFIVEGIYLRTQQRHYLRLAHKWAKATGLVFAIGAVSGTALSFELGLLWPKYIEMLGAAVGHAFALEGFAFFIEAIFIGLYLFGRRRMPPVAHWLCAGVVAFSGFASGVFVLAVNAWMQIPVGITLDSAGHVIATDPLAIFQSEAWITMSIHSSLACYISIPLAMAGIYGVAFLRGRRDAYCRSAILISMSIAGIAALLQPFSGDLISRFVYHTQPAKFAALEAQFPTMTYAPVHLGGFPDTVARKNRGAIEIPGALSFLATGDFSARITGLDDIPRDRWPNVALTHLAFDVMVGSGTLITFASIVFWIGYWKKRNDIFNRKLFLWMTVLVSPLGILALEAGWVVTECGRQPWIIQGLMLTRDAVTPSGNIPLVFFGFSALYLAMGTMVVVLLRRLADEFVPMSWQATDHNLENAK
jgi:cytochrome bd ubiquinol oxidase subunit I